MILRKKEINLQFLGVQVLDLCPDYETNEFVDGYLHFVNVFFEELHYCSEAFHRLDDGYDVDLQLTMEMTLENLDLATAKLRNDQKEAFWLGVLSASEYSQRTLQFAFEVQPRNKAA